MTTHTEITTVERNMSNAQRVRRAEARIALLPCRATRTNATSTRILDCGDWQASNAPGGFAAFLARASDVVASTLPEYVSETVRIGMSDATTSDDVDAVDALCGMLDD